MPAVILNGILVIGYNERLTEKELYASGCTFVMVDSIPSIVSDPPPNCRVLYVDGDFVSELVETSPENMTVYQQLEDLRTRLAAAELELQTLKNAEG